MTPEDAALCERLKGIATTDHERMCEGRNYACTCGWDEENMEIGNQAAATIERLSAENEALRKGLERAADDLQDIGTQSPAKSGRGTITHENYLRRTLISLAQLANTRARTTLKGADQ